MRYSYIHRVGRTGRNGRSGQAVTLYTTPDRQLVRAFAEVILQSGGGLSHISFIICCLL